MRRREVPDLGDQRRVQNNRVKMKVCRRSGAADPRYQPEFGLIRNMILSPADNDIGPRKRRGDGWRRDRLQGVGKSCTRRAVPDRRRHGEEGTDSLAATRRGAATAWRAFQTIQQAPVDDFVFQPSSADAVGKVKDGVVATLARKYRFDQDKGEAVGMWAPSKLPSSSTLLPRPPSSSASSGAHSGGRRHRASKSRTWWSSACARSASRWRSARAAATSSASSSSRPRRTAIGGAPGFATPGICAVFPFFQVESVGHAGPPAQIAVDHDRVLGTIARRRFLPGAPRRRSSRSKR